MRAATRPHPVGSVPGMRNSHGQTPAAWTSVTVILVGAIVAGFGVATGLVWLAVTGGVVMVLGIVVALVMQKAGLGQYPPGRSRSYASAEAYLGAQREENGQPADPEPSPAGQVQAADAVSDPRACDRKLSSGT